MIKVNHQLSKIGKYKKKPKILSCHCEKYQVGVLLDALVLNKLLSAFYASVLYSKTCCKKFGKIDNIG